MFCRRLLVCGAFLFLAMSLSGSQSVDNFSNTAPSCRHPTDFRAYPPKSYSESKLSGLLHHCTQDAVDPGRVAIAITDEPVVPFPVDASGHQQAPQLPPDYWATAAIGKYYRPLKTEILVRIDSEVLDWLKSKGQGHLSRINEILRDRMTRDSAATGAVHSAIPGSRLPKPPAI